MKKPLSYRRRHRLKQVAQRQAAEAAKPKPRKDPAVEMVKGTALESAIGQQLRDPLFMPSEQLDERQRVMQAVDLYENDSMPCGFRATTSPLVVAHSAWAISWRVNGGKLTTCSQGCRLTGSSQTSVLRTSASRSIPLRIFVVVIPASRSGHKMRQCTTTGTNDPIDSTRQTTTEEG
jgi:hypothetical protein